MDIEANPQVQQNIQIPQNQNMFVNIAQIAAGRGKSTKEQLLTVLEVQRSFL